MVVMVLRGRGLRHRRLSLLVVLVLGGRGLHDRRLSLLASLELLIDSGAVSAGRQRRVQMILSLGVGARD